MVKMKGLKTLLLMMLQFQAILSSDEVSQNSILERLDSIEAVQELHNLKIEQVETLFTGLKGKVERLEIKDKEILGDLEKLDQKIASVSSSVSSLSSSKITAEQRLQSKSDPIQLELSGDDITKSTVSGFHGKITNKMNPTTVTPLTTKLTTALKTGPDFKVVRTLPLDHAEGTSYPLMNKHGKCLAVETTGKVRPYENGAKIVQSTCNPTERGQLWKYDTEKLLLCNDWKKCLTFPFNLEWGPTSDVFQWDRISREKHQQWDGRFGAHRFLIFGYCLEIEGNSDGNGQRAITRMCGYGEKGQTWSFVQLRDRIIF